MLGRSIAVVGNVGAAEAKVIHAAAKAVGVGLHAIPDPSDAASVLEAEEPIAVVLRTEAEGAYDTCVAIRSRRRFAHVPILGVSEHRTPLSFVELFHWGGDDLVSTASPAALVRRLRPLLAAPPASKLGAGAHAGEAIVARTDPQWGAVLARSLSNAGIATRFVSDATEALERASDARFVIAPDDIAPAGADAAVETARARGVETPFVIVAPPKRIAAVQAAVAHLSGVAVVDAFAPPENALFAANDLVRVGHEQRTSARLLFGTSVSFRAAGREEEDEIGFTYNVSTGGVFIRTLAPLAMGEEIWLELWAPRSPRRVRLSGRVAWRRVFGPNEAATVPPGIGVQIVDGLGEDLARWRSGCDALESDVRAATQRPKPLRTPQSVLA